MDCLEVIACLKLIVLFALSHTGDLVVLRVRPCAEIFLAHMSDDVRWFCISDSSQEDSLKNLGIDR